MRTQAPKTITIIIAAVLAIVGLLGSLGVVAQVAQYSFWLVFIAWALVTAGALIDGI